MLGVVSLDKPVGPTSHDMVGLMRRLTGTRRIGHAGTLDPLASGVLPILIGPATRFSEELTGGRKRYDAVIRLGLRSATDDAEGPLETVDGDLPDEARIARELRGFVGTFDQRPPAFSARKQGGRTAHREARAGAPIEMSPRRVTIDQIDLLRVTVGEGFVDLRVDVRCGPGTYVRSLARDLGDRIGCGGYLASLRRTEAAGLLVEDALAPDALERLAREDRLAEAVRPVAPLLSFPRVELDDRQAGGFRHGTVVRIGSPVSDGRHAVLHRDRLLGIGTIRSGMLQPEKVIAAEEAS